MVVVSCRYKAAGSWRMHPRPAWRRKGRCPTGSLVFAVTRDHGNYTFKSVNAGPRPIKSIGNKQPNNDPVGAPNNVDYL